MKIVIGSDHRGFVLKGQLVEMFKELKIDYSDFGTYDEESTDYPKFAFKVGEAVSRGEFDYGVVICGSGAGVCISANKVKGIRCVLVRSIDEVKMAREHNNINVLGIGAEHTSAEEAFEMIETLINTTFLEGRHRRRIELIEKYENK